MVEDGKDKGSTMGVCEKPEIVDSSEDKNGKRSEDQKESPHKIECMSEDSATSDMSQGQGSNERTHRTEERAAQKVVGLLRGGGWELELGVRGGGMVDVDAKHGLIVIAKVVHRKVWAASSGELEGGGGFDGACVGRGEVGGTMEVVALVGEGIDTAAEVVVGGLGSDVGAGGLDAAHWDGRWRRRGGRL